jgi:MoaA/NifB/PqqE/SkfB family radical SAM enzyme
MEVIGIFCNAQDRRNMRPKIEIGISLNGSCNFHCRMCHIWKNNDSGQQLNFEKACEIVDALDRFQVKGVRLSGGEPLLVPWALDLARHINDKGYPSVITTNGSMIDRALADKIIFSGISYVNLSLDGHNAEIQDSCRGFPGSFNKVMKAIEFLAGKKDLSIGINTVISGMNIDSIVPLSHLVQQDKRIGYIYFMAVMQPFGSHPDREWFLKKEYHCLWPQDVKKTGVVIDELIRLKNQGYKINNSSAQLKTFARYFTDPLGFTKRLKCNLGEEQVEINQLGNVYLCYHHESIGNVFKDNLFNIWNSDKAEEIREKIRACRQNCNLLVNCYFEEDV